MTESYQSTEEKNSQPQQDEIDLRSLIARLWRGRILILGIALVTTVIGVVFTFLTADIYRAEVLLAPRTDESVGGLASLAAQYGGLANLAGIGLSPSSSDKTALGLEVVRSRKFLSEFIDRHKLLIEVMAAKSWDIDTNTLIIDSDIYDTSTDQWVRNVRSPRQQKPSLQEAYDKFIEEILTISQDLKTGFVRISVDFYSPELARTWAEGIVRDLNRAIQRQDVREAEQAIMYLKGQIELTSLSEMRAVFFALIAEQTKTLMLAQANEEYLFKTIDPAIIPEERISPNRILISALSIIFGVILGILTVIIHGMIKDFNLPAQDLD